MTTSPRAPGADDAGGGTLAARRGIVEVLASRGVVTASVESLFGGREWSVTVAGHPTTMTETEVRVTVWTAVLNGTAVHALPAPEDGVRVLIAGRR